MFRQFNIFKAFYDRQLCVKHVAIILNKKKVLLIGTIYLMRFIKWSKTQRDEYYQISFYPLLYVKVTELYKRTSFNKHATVNFRISWK